MNYNFIIDSRETPPIIIYEFFIIFYEFNNYCPKTSVFFLSSVNTVNKIIPIKPCVMNFHGYIELDLEI